MNPGHDETTASPVGSWNLGEPILSIQYDARNDCLYALGRTSLYRKDRNGQDFRKVLVIATPESGAPKRECYSFCSSGDTIFATLIGVDARVINAAWIGDASQPASGRLETRFSGLMTMFAQSEHNACFDDQGTLYIASPETVLYSTDKGRTYRPHAYINQEFGKLKGPRPQARIQNIKAAFPGRTSAFIGTTLGALCCYEGDDTADTIAYYNPAVTSTVNYAYDAQFDHLVSWLYLSPQAPQALYSVNIRMLQAHNDDPKFTLGPGSLVNAPQYAVDPDTTAIAVSSTTSYTGPNFYLAVRPLGGPARQDEPSSDSALRQVLFFSRQEPLEPGIETGDGFPARLAPLPVRCMHQYAAQLYIGTDSGILQYRESDIMPSFPA